VTRSAIAAVDQRQFDVIVVGAGANGSSAAQHLAALGFDVLIVDKGDFASGTSSRSSRLLHCGLQYLVQETPLAGASRLSSYLRRPFDILASLAAARRTMHCRTQLVRETPERVRPVTFFYPVYENSHYPAWKIKLAFRILASFGSRAVPLEFKEVAGAPARALPFVRLLAQPDRLRSVAIFREYQYDWAERICLDAVLDAERMGATIRNYTSVKALSHRPDASRAWHVVLEDGLEPGAQAHVTAHVLLNIAGPWVDRVNSLTKTAVERRVIGVKGINVLLKFPDECAGFGLECLNSLGQAYYAMPWGPYHFIGPTATVYEGDPDDVRPSEEEIGFLIAETNRLFPTFNLRRSDVIYAWAGVRARTHVSGAEVRRRASTIHDLAADGMPDAFALTETPIMLHRSAGAELARRVARTRKPSGKPMQLSFLPPQLPASSSVPPINSRIPTLTLASLRHAAATEHVVNLIDLLFRRVNLGWGDDMGTSLAHDAARAVSDILGWDEMRIALEVERYRAYLVEHFLPSRMEVVTK